MEVIASVVVMKEVWAMEVVVVTAAEVDMEVV